MQIPSQVQPSEKSEKWSRFWGAIRELFFGMVGYEFTLHAQHMRASLESLFMLGTIGQMIGIPVLPPYYSLRLLPYLYPHIDAWKRRVLRERDFTEEHDYHLEGL